MNHEAAFPFQAPRPPKAVRSPSGQPPQYLKKNSPSPTSIKLPPGHLSPPEPMQTITTTKYSEEHEVIPKHVINGSSNGNESETGVEEMSMNPEDTGKLGTLVFKLRYLTERNALTVSVVRCRGLQKQPVSSTEKEEKLFCKSHIIYYTHSTLIPFRIPTAMVSMDPTVRHRQPPIRM